MKLIKREVLKNYIDNKYILRCIVGSQAHGLAGPNSDYDYRGVFVVPTKEILSLGGHKTNTNWIEGKNDDTSWEIGHFLNLAIHSNPTILETFLAPRIHPEDNLQITWGAELQELFPHVWSSVGVMNAFIGYGVNQRKKFFDNKDNRAQKYASAYLRVLYNAWELLTTGTFTIKIADCPGVGETLKRWKVWTPDQVRENAGEIIELCLHYEQAVRQAYLQNPDKKTNMEPINEFLLKVRKAFWI